MAKTKSQAKKLSRRQMVMLLGSGVVFAPAGESVVEAQGPIPCERIKPLKGTGNKNQPVLVGDPCCKEGVQIFRAGFNALKDKKVKDHFKDFNDALTASQNKMMDYCVMVWGLQKDEKDAFVKDVQARYRLS